MHDTFLKFCAISSFVGALGLPANAEQIVDLEEVTFSADLTETSLAQVTSSVDVFTQDNIRDSGASNLTDFLRRVPGISITQSGGVGQTATVRMRGTDGSYTAIYVDGIRIDDPSGTQTQTNIGQLSLSNIERIEVLRGSQSALYGGSAVGGVLSITTLQVKEDGLQQSVSIQGGSFGTIDLNYGLRYRSERLELAFGATYKETSGQTAFEGAPEKEVYDSNAEKDGYQRTNLNLAMRYQLTESLKIGLSGLLQESETEYDISDRFGFRLIDPNSDGVEAWKKHGIRLFAELQTGVGRQELGISRYRISRRYVQSVTSTRPVGELFWPESSDITFTGIRTKLDWKGTTNLPGDSLKFVYGLDWVSEENKQEDAVSFIYNKSGTFGVYSQLIASPTDHLDLTSAIRYDKHSEFGGFTTGRAGFSWRASEGLSIRAQVATGYRAPSNFELFSSYGDPNLTPETSTSSEVGVDYWTSFGARLTATIFDIRVRDKIDYDFPTEKYAQISATKSRGVEISAEIPISHFITTNFSYTYTDAKITEGPLKDTRVPRIPYHNASISAQLEMDSNLHGAIGLTHVAGRTEDLESYTVADVSLRYGLTPSTNFSISIKNFLGTDYQEISGFKAQGRSVYFGLESRF